MPSMAPSMWKLFLDRIMQMKMGKIVMFGSMLAVVSFLVGLFQSSLPLMILSAVQMSFELFIFFCYGLSGIIFCSLDHRSFSLFLPCSSIRLG